MPTIRIGFSSDFVLNNNRVGLGTTVAAGGNLDVDGAIKGNFSVAGVATLASYGGFVVQKQQIKKPSTIGFATVGLNTAGAAIGVGATQVANQYYETETGFTDLGGVHHGDDQYFNTLSEDLVIDDGQILNITNTDMVGVTTIGEYDPHNHSSYVCAGSLEQVSVTDHFSVPNGGTNDRQLIPIEGTVRFNTDLATLEFFNGNEWRQFTVTGASGRGYFAGANPDTGVSENRIATIQIQTLGSASYFGDLSVGRRNGSTGGGVSSSTRGIMGGGFAPTVTPNNNTDIIDYWTMSSQGNAEDFGDLTRETRNHGSCSSSTRGLFGGGEPGPTNTIDYIEMETKGDALDFGDLTVARQQTTGTSSPIIGVFISGEGTGKNNLMDTVNITSKGDAIKFGDLTAIKYNCGAVSNGVRGVIGSGYGGPGVGARITSMDYITFASQGNSVDFGDRTEAADCASSCDMTRGVFKSEYASPSKTRSGVCDYITIASAGNAIDWGDMIDEASQTTGNISDSHGGLGGF